VTTTVARVAASDSATSVHGTGHQKLTGICLETGVVLP